MGLGKKSHLPVFKILDFSFGPTAVVRIMWSTRKFALEDLGDEAVVKTGKSTLRLNRRKAALMVSEWKLWNEYYLPPSGLTGKTVLDVGAGCGETAALMFEKGAKKVVCVEPSMEEVRYLEENVKANGWDAEVVPTGFDVSMLRPGFDFVKMDCEGCEASLLSLEKLPNVIAEVHSVEMKKAFVDKGMRVTKDMSEHTCIMSNAR
jgi:ribosomal protein L11 methylase PrmA